MHNPLEFPPIGPNMLTIFWKNPNCPFNFIGIYTKQFHISDALKGMKLNSFSFQ